MGLMNINLWRNSYMLEFIKGSTVENAFTFSLPPESEELKFRHRINETKTFGGSIFDSYGNDTIEISLSGSTANDELKFIYCGTKKAPKFLSGESEIFELQKIITDWNKVENEIQEKKVILYDLSKTNFLELAAGIASKNFWRVFIKSFNIKRDKNRPNLYSYSLELYGVNEEKNRGLELSGFAQAAEGITTALDVVKTVADYTEGTVAITNDIVSKVKKCKSFFSSGDFSTPENAVLTVASKIDSKSRLLSGNNNNLFYNSTRDILRIIETWEHKVKFGDNEKKNKTENNQIYIIYFENHDDKNVKNQSVEYSAKVNRPLDPIKEHFAFVGWYKDKECTLLYDFDNEVKNSFSLYAKWEATQIVVTFNSRGGSAVESQVIQIGETARIPENPTKDGFILKSWNINALATLEFDFSTPLFKNITLYASWDTVFEVVFDTDGGTQVENQIVGINRRVLYPLTPKKENFIFSFWATSDDKTIAFDFSKSITSDLTLYAVYTQISNTVYFNSNGGTQVEKQNVKVGSLLQKPMSPIKEGFDFVYWCIDKESIHEFNFLTTKINHETTLYAKWEISVFEVVFDTDGGSVIESQNVNYGNFAIFPIIPTKENCVFSMWQIKTIETKTQENERGETEEIEVEVYKEFDFSTPIKSDIKLKALYLEAIK